jgi:Fe-S cluster assembly protein SufD
LQARDSKFSSTTVSLSGSLIRNNLNIVIDAENCESNLYGLYVLNGKSHVDNHTLVDHAKPRSYSNELYKGILDEKSTGVFNGKIMVRPDAQKTNAFQSNRNIVLSAEASMNTKPQLEIFADDVKCSHGATTGQLDEEMLFYLRSRGIGLDAASPADCKLCGRRTDYISGWSSVGITWRPSIATVSSRRPKITTKYGF